MASPFSAGEVGPSGLAGVEARSVQIRLLVAVTGVSALLLLLIGMVVVERISDLIRSNVQTAALDLVQVKAKEIEGFFTDRGRVVSTLFANPTVLGWFAGYDQFRRPLEGDEHYAEVIGFFRALRDRDDTVVSVFLATEATSEYFHAGGRVEREGYDPKGRWWWAEAVAKDRLYVSPPGVDAGTGDISVTVQTTVYSEDGRFLGVGGIDVLLGTLGDLVGEITYQGTGHAFLIDDVGQLIYFPELVFDPQRVGDRLTTRLEEMGDAFADSSGFGGLARHMRDRASDLHRLRWQGQDMIVVWAPVHSARPELHWTLGLMVPEETITAPARRARLHTMLTVLLTVLVIAAITLVATNRVVSTLRSFDQQRARELAETNVRLVAASRMKTQFLATMSHELRTPLNAIIGFSDLLRKRLEERSEEKLLRYADNIYTSGRQLLAMISEILDLSRIEAGRMQLRPESVDVARTIEAVCAVVCATARERDVSVEVDCPEEVGRVEVDPVRFKQILFNLLSNAVKFSEDGSEVRVMARAVDAGESPLATETVRIAVIDRGIGIDPEALEVIFDEFRQLEAWNERKYSGAGLGLALVRRFVDFHGGEISVDSRPGEGSTFTVDLPRRYQGPEPEGRGEAEPP